jgi:hypothetical protein
MNKKNFDSVKMHGMYVEKKSFRMTTVIIIIIKILSLKFGVKKFSDIF